MKCEKLIEELHRLCDETDVETSEATQSWLVNNIRAALSRFEKAQAPRVAVSDGDRDAVACSIFMADRSDKLTIDECAPIADEVMSIFSRLGRAQAPTDDEREALSNFLFSVYEHGSQPNALREADAILSFLASRRPAQIEPTDAQIEAAAKACMYNGAQFIRDNTQGYEAYAIEGGLFYVRDFLRVIQTTSQEEQS